MMSLYTRFLQEGISPSQLDDTDLEDWFYMFEGAETKNEQYIDDLLGR